MDCANSFYREFDEEIYGERDDDVYRTRFQQDRDQILHSYAFRRLQAKTQVFRPGEYDFYRTRLTHSIEVAQIGRSICNVLRKKWQKKHPLEKDFYVNADLVEAVCLAHDLGHPPFGHAGERKLNELMKNYGGFDANAQTLRLLTKLLKKTEGINPTRALLDGVLKNKKCRCQSGEKEGFLYADQRPDLEFVFRGECRINPEWKSVECRIMDWADEIAYSVDDVVDGARAGLITTKRLDKWESDHREDAAVQALKASLECDTLVSFGAETIGKFIECCELEESANCALDTNRHKFTLRIPQKKIRERKCFKAIAKALVFQSPKVSQLEFKAKMMLDRLFKALEEAYITSPPREGTPHLVGDDVECNLRKTCCTEEKARVLCDHISAMSDDYVIRTYRRLFEPEFGSIVDLV